MKLSITSWPLFLLGCFFGFLCFTTGSFVCFFFTRDSCRYLCTATCKWAVDSIYCRWHLLFDYRWTLQRGSSFVIRCGFPWGDIPALHIAKVWKESITTTPIHSSTWLCWWFVCNGPHWSSLWSNHTGPPKRGKWDYLQGSHNKEKILPMVILFYHWISLYRMEKNYNIKLI